MEEKNCIEIMDLKKSLNENEDEEGDFIPDVKSFDKKQNDSSSLNISNEDKISDAQKINEVTDKEKKSLILVKEKLSKMLTDINKNIIDVENENKDLGEIYEKYLNLNGFISKKDIKDRIKDNCLCFIFNVLCPIFVIINLIGIFQMISVMKILLIFIKNSIKCFLPFVKCEKTDFYSFFDFYYKELLNEEVDYNLMMFFGFLGNISLGRCGFKWSSLIFYLINIPPFFMIYNFNFDGFNEKTNKYQYCIQTIYIIVMYLFLSVGIGGSALLPQQILLDFFYKYQNKNEINDKNNINIQSEQNNNQDSNKNNLDYNNTSNENRKRDLNFFFIVCLTTILGYYLKYLLDIFLAVIFQDSDKRNFFVFNYIVYFSSIVISVLIYWATNVCIFRKKDDDKSKNTPEIKICRICGYLIYSEEINSKNVSLRCESCKLCCDILVRCINKSICDFVCCQSDINDKDKFRCCDQEEKYLRYYDSPKNVYLCYCYKETRKFKWFNKFINNDGQINLTKIMFNYCILQLIVIAFEKIYNDNQEKIKNDGNNLNNLLDRQRISISFIIYINIIIIFFYITISWGKYTKDSTDETDQTKENQSNEEQEKLSHSKTKKMTKGMKNLSDDIIRGATVILGFNSLFSFIFTIFYFSNNTSLKNIIINSEYNYIYAPILMNKFYYFTFIYYCIKVTEEIKGFDLMSGSTLISIYLFIWNFIFGFLRDLTPIKYIHILFGLQMIPSGCITFKFLLIIFNNLFCRGMFWKTCLYLFFYCLACGGVWFFGCCDCCKCCTCCKCFESKENFDECCKCCDNCNYCENEKCSKTLNELMEFKCFKKGK